MGVFGWSLPAGCGKLPDEEEPYEQPRCRKCGAYLPWTADRTEYHASREPSGEIFADRTDYYRTCRRCNAENEDDY